MLCTTFPHVTRRSARMVVVPLVMSLLALGAAPALADVDPGAPAGQTGIDSHAASRDISKAMQHDLGLTPAQVREQGSLQAEAIKLDQRLQDSLGSAYTGSKYSERAGKLVVMVSDAAHVAEARAAGATVRLVKHTMAKLQGIKAELDGWAADEHVAGALDRDAAPAGSAVTGMTSWAVAPERNAVHVTVKPDRLDAVRDALAKYGDAVIIEPADVSQTAAATAMDGGDAIFNERGGQCSAGFNLRNWSTGASYLLTAGHCFAGMSTYHSGVRGANGLAFGTVWDRPSPPRDDALVRADWPAAWTQGPWVDQNPSNSTDRISVSAVTDAPKGTAVCKSGVTTKWTCGRITEKDQTVRWDDGTVLTGLTQHDACVEPGDSGGPTVSVTTVSKSTLTGIKMVKLYRAEGVTSGMRYLWDGAAQRCLSAFGGQNVSWYFPIADSLALFGPRYGVTLW